MLSRTLIAPASCLKTIQRRSNAWPTERPSLLCFGQLPAIPYVS